VGKILDIDYVAFCGGPRPDWETRGLVNNDATRIRAEDLKIILDSNREVRIIDVRPRTEFGICHLPGSINVPLSELVADPTSHLLANGEVQSTYIVCRLGNDSQIAANALRALSSGIVIMDLIGGLKAWTKHVDPHFPEY